MKALSAIAILSCSVLAQGTQQETVQQELKTPRPPSTGRQEKVTEFVPMKDGVAEAPATVTPAAVTPAAQPSARAERARPPMDAALAASATRALDAALRDPDFVLVDQPVTDGPLWVMGSNYKASFAPAGWSFIPQPSTGAPTLAPIQFHLRGAQVGSKALAVGDAKATRTARRIEYRHGDVVEVIDVGGRGVEQSFTFASLPERGELVVEIDVVTTLAGSPHGDGIRFTDAFNEVTYSQAVAIDASGARVAAVTTLAAGRLTIRVPRQFVERAELPLVIDPYMGANSVTDSHDLGDPDVAWDEGSQRLMLVWARYFGGGDWDCYVEPVFFPAQLLNPVMAIDYTTDAWQRPRIANLHQYGRFLVVAQVRAGTNPVKIAGRITDTGAAMVTGQFDIAADAVDNLRPDVAGDPALAPPTYFTVVWEHAYSANDHDIYARQVTSNGTLRGTSPTYVQTDTHYQSYPSVSKSDGAAPFGSQRFAIVYQQTFSGSDEDIYCAMLTWDGVIVPVAGSNTFLVDFSGYRDTFPQVSSPTLPWPDGSRKMLAVYERTNLNGGDVVATCFDQAGARLAGADVNVIENNPVRLPWPQSRPSVDSDGYRFAVGYHESPITLPSNLNTLMSLVALTNNGTLVTQETDYLAYGIDPEFNVQVASKYSGSAAYDKDFAVTNDRDRSNGTFAIDIWGWDAVPTAGFRTRTTACGNLSISRTGSTALGGALSVTVTSSSLNWSQVFAGFVAGLPTNAPIAPCPGCTLGVNGSVVIGAPVAGPTGTVVGTRLAWSTPVNPALFGSVTAVQGFVFDPNGGPCLGQISFSSTIDITVQ